MNRALSSLLAALVAVPVLAQAEANKLGDYTLTYKPGKIELKALSQAKLRVTLVGKGAAVVTMQSPERVVRAHKVVAVAEKRGPKQEAQVTEATATGAVFVQLTQKDTKGNVYRYTITCEQAELKSGSKPKTGRIDFSGNAKLVYDTPLLDGETTGTKGYLDLGDPDDPEKLPVFELEDGVTTGRPKTKGKNP